MNNNKSYFIARDNAIYVFYVAALNGEITPQMFEKCKEILNRAELPRFVKVTVEWGEN